MNYGLHRRKLESKLASIRQQTLEKTGVATQDQSHDHNWETYVEQIRRSRTPAQEKRMANVRGYDPTRIPLSAFFRTIECKVCHVKHRLNYRVGDIKVPEGMEVRPFKA